MLKTFFIQIFILLIIMIILQLLKKIIYCRRKKHRIKIIDTVPLITLYYIHVLTVNSRGFSLDPYLIIIWAILGLFFLSVWFFKANHFNEQWRFYLDVWRIGDLYLLIAWIVIGILSI